MSTDDKYSHCPDCGRKTVYFKMARYGEDHYRCRRSECGFYFFTGGESHIDRAREERWKAAQPKQEHEL